ncbi:sialidase family protein [Pontiellaceae bacterium B12227]|nr:sialidase family protein [Pontiellaceae bacterium B12227]
MRKHSRYIVAGLLLPVLALGADFSGVPGTVLDHQSTVYDWFYTTPRVFIADPDIAVLADGSYVATDALAGRSSGADSSGETSIFRSTDQGATWAQVATLNGVLRGSLVEYGGALYLMGVNNTDTGDAVICKSTDGGLSWTQTATFSNGGSATPNNPVVYGDRLWSAASAASMSAPITSNWMDTSSWKLAGGFPAYEEGWASEGEFIGEAQIAASPEQGISILPKVKQHALSALAQVDPSTGKVSFDPWHNFVSMPGGEKKFGAGYDSVSGRFFVLSNPILAAHANTGIANDMIRNTAALLSSSDLVNWNVEKIFLYSTDYEKDGFGYLNFDVDGDDMVVASRTAFPVGDDDPERGHDSNLLTFHRIADFRTAFPDHVLKLSGGDVLRFEKTDHQDAPLGNFTLGSSFDGAALADPNGFGQAANGDVYIRESGGRILQFDASGNFLQVTNSAPVTFQSSELSIDPPSNGECSWVSSGSGDWFEPLNWHYWGRADTPDEIAVFGSAATGPATITVPSGSLEWLFDVDGDVGGWTLTRLVGTNVTNGVLQGTPSSNDPQIKRTDLSFYGNLVSSIVVRMRAEVNNSRVDLYWGTSAANAFSADRKVTVNYTGNGAFQEVVFPMAGTAQWDDQVIRSIRIDPLNGAKVALEVDSIEIIHTHHVKGITFRNSQPYTLAGAQFLVVKSDDGPSRLAVEQGSHQIQASMRLDSDTVFSAQTNSALLISGGLNLAGKTLAVSGAGDLSITNSFRLEGGTLSIELGSTVSLDGDAAVLDGSLVVSAPAAFSPAVGDSFRLIEGEPGTNRFDAVVLPALEDGLNWDTSALYTGGRIDVQLAVPVSWLEGYDLPTDGSADFIDTDGDGMDNYSEWKAGTNPTNRLSRFLLSCAPSGAADRVELSWNSLTSRTYCLDFGTNLLDSPAFSTLIPGIPGEQDVTVIAVTNSNLHPAGYYRISIE